MKCLMLSLLVLLMLSISAFSQNNSELKTVEFISPIIGDGEFSRDYPYKNCFSFITESMNCNKVSDLYYGTLRSGNDWDWLQVIGAGNRNKIKSLGKKNWTEEIKIPVIEPYAKLKPGEQRLVVFGEEGKNLPNPTTIDAQNSDIFPGDLESVKNLNSKLETKQPKSDYKPFQKAVLGSMYIIRVVDENNDFYVLFRVDELERGKRCKISWKKVDAPKDN